MGMKYKQVGGTPNKGLPQDFASLLQSGLTGSFGSAGAVGQYGASNPVGSTGGVSGIINDILSGGAGKIGGSMMDMISRQSDKDVGALRARFGAGGGSAFGTPGAYAESVLRSETAPKLTSAIGGLQENLLSQLLPLYMNAYNRGTPQAEIVGQESPWMSAAKLGLVGAGTALGFMAGGPAGAAAGASIGSSVFGKPAMTISGSPSDAYPMSPPSWMSPNYNWNG